MKDDSSVLGLGVEFVFMRETAGDGDERVVLVINGRRVAETIWSPDSDEVTRTIEYYCQRVRLLNEDGPIYDLIYSDNRRLN